LHIVKKNLLLLCVIFIILSLYGCSATTDESPNTTSNTKPSINPVFYNIYPDYPTYENAEEIKEAATNIYVGTVKDISFEIINIKTGKVDSSFQPQNTNRMLYTVYTITIKESIQGVNPTEIKLCTIGGWKGYKVNEQQAKLQAAGISQEDNSIPIVSDNTFVRLDIGEEYLFCTSRTIGDFDFPINLSQYAHSKESEIRAEIIKSVK